MVRWSLLLLLAISGLRAAETSPLKVLSNEGLNATAWVLSPLEQAVPPDIRQKLTALRESLLDEGKTGAKTGLDAYRSGFFLCNALLGALDDRDAALLRAGIISSQGKANNSLNTTQELEARRNFMERWPQYFREEGKRDDVRAQAFANSGALAERLKGDWGATVAQLRTKIDSLYSKFRDSLRADPKMVALLNGSDTAAPAPVVAASTPTSVPTTPAPAPTRSTSTISSAPEVPGQCTIEVEAVGSPVSKARVFITEAREKGEETLAEQGETEGGRYTFAPKDGIRYNLYVVADGYRIAAKKGQNLSHPAHISLATLPTGSSSLVEQKGAGFGLFAADQDLTPTRPSQASPPESWIFKSSEGLIIESKGLSNTDRRNLTAGEFWVHDGESFKMVRDGKNVTCKLIGSVARQFVLLEVKR